MPNPIERSLPFLVGCAALALGAILIVALYGTPPSSRSMAQVVVEALPDSGVTNPVTAVLLNFRAFDTLLEIAVLMLTLVAVWALGLRLPEVETLPASSVFNSLLRVSVPPLVVIAGYLLWVGATEPGGAFQAGALLAGGCLLLRLAGVWHPNPTLLRWVAVAGLLVFLFIGLAMLGLTGGLLQFPVASAGIWILVIEAAATVSIAAILTALFVAKEPAVRERKP